MSSISSLGSSTSTYQSFTSQRPTRPSASTVAADIFSNLDTKGQGYLQLSDFVSAFAGIDGSSTGTSTGSSSSVSDVFAQIDANGDGKVTQSELSSKLQELADTLDSQFNQSRMNGATAAAGAPPPPPPGEDKGLSEDQVNSIANDSTSSDSNLTSLLKTVAANFDAADTNGDGKVTFKEAQAYAQESAKSSSNSSTTAAATTAGSSDETVLRRILDLVRAYSAGEGGTASSAASAISVSA